MKKISLSIIALSVLGFSSVAMADTSTAQATATWRATAIKDTKGQLVVTPLRSLTFNYITHTKSFNQQSGAFDIAIEGLDGATSFKLTSKLVTDTLKRTTDDSELTVGVDWNGSKLSKTTETLLIDTMDGTTSGLEGLVTGDAYKNSGRASDRGEFEFSIDKANDGSGPVSFDALTDGSWDGDVRVQFTATWTGTFS